MKALFFAIPFALLGQSGQPAAQDPAKAVLEGQVLNSVTGEPLRKARLTLRMNGGAMTAQRPGQPVAGRGYTAISDAAGKFEFRNVDPGDYHLAVRRDGFAGLLLGARYGISKSDPIVLSAGDRKADFVVRLVPHGSISGIIFDEDGDPIRAITVSAMTWRYTPNGREFLEVFTATSNDLGEYRIYDVPAGRYFLRAGQSDMRAGGREEDADAFASVFYPGFPQVAGAIAQEVAAGSQLRNLNFNLRTTRYATLRGRVAAPPDATGVVAGMMTVVGSGTSSTSGSTAGKDSRFEFFGVAPGSLYLTAE